MIGELNTQYEINIYRNTMSHLDDVTIENFKLYLSDVSSKHDNIEINFYDHRTSRDIAYKSDPDFVWIECDSVLSELWDKFNSSKYNSEKLIQQ